MRRGADRKETPLIGIESLIGDDAVAGRRLDQVKLCVVRVGCSDGPACRQLDYLTEVELRGAMRLPQPVNSFRLTVFLPYPMRLSAKIIRNIRRAIVVRIAQNVEPVVQEN